MHQYLKKRKIEAILKFGNHFYHDFFRQYFGGCPRVSSFHLNNLGNEVGNELQSRCQPHNCKLDQEYPENCAETCVHEGG